MDFEHITVYSLVNFQYQIINIEYPILYLGGTGQRPLSIRIGWLLSFVEVHRTIVLVRNLGISMKGEGGIIIISQWPMPVFPFEARHQIGHNFYDYLLSST